MLGSRPGMPAGAAVQLHCIGWEVPLTILMSCRLC